MRHAVILAGGSGVRLWPLSRPTRPKQFLQLVPGGPSLLASAVARAGADAADVTVVTAARFHADTVAQVPTATVLAEPAARNTAAAIGLATVWLLARDPDAVLGVLPADQYIGDEPAMRRVLAQAWQVAEGGGQPICTIGVRPTRAETGFGYLELVPGDAAVRTVRRFVEKPDAATAQRLASDGLHLWNGGMFFASAARLRRELARHLPELARGLDVIAAALAQDGEEGFARALAEVYPTLPSISIDHGVMERCGDLACVPAEVGWDDVGSFASLDALLPHDAAGNAVIGDAVVHGTGNLVMSDRGVVAVSGLDDIVVIRRGDAVQVIPRDRSQDVRALVEEIERRGLGDHK